MSGVDLVVRGASLVGERIADVGVVDGAITAIEPELAGAREEIDARGLVALPGAIDAHVHLNDPGRAHWEGIPSGTRALAAGGTTCALDMPLNASPPTCDGPSFDAKARAVAGAAHVDLALWGGLVPGPPERMDELAARGVVGFKAFMSSSGTDDFARADDLTLLEGMARAAALGLPVAVHAESEELTARLARRAIAAGRVSMADYLASRPVVAELEAIARALTFAAETGCALHVVHVSSARGVALVAAARARGVDATCETCPHYLALDARAARELGAAVKCAPPLREPAEREALRERVLGGDVDMIATDHSPAPPELRRGDDLFAAWGGIAGAQTLLSLLLDEGLPPAALARLCARAPAERFGLAAKGALAVGNDADVALIDPAGGAPLRRAELHDRHRANPFVGRRLAGRVVRVLLRGRTIARDGQPVGPPAGRLLRGPGAR